DDILVGRARPFDKGDGDRVIAPAGDRSQYPRVGHRRRVAFALEVEFPVIDAARHIGREHEKEIDRLGPRDRDTGKPRQQRYDGSRCFHHDWRLPVRGQHKLPRPAGGRATRRARLSGAAEKPGGPAMAITQERLTIETRPREIKEITRDVAGWAA